MTDPKIRQAILAANHADAQQAADQHAMQIAAQGTAMALGQQPVFEMVELSGQLAIVAFLPGFARVMVSGIGSTKAYTVQLPIDWLKTVISEHDKQHPAEPSDEQPAAEPGEEAAA